MLCKDDDDDIDFDMEQTEKNKFSKLFHAQLKFIILSLILNKASIRPVLLKEVRDEKFIFFTNYNSRKS